ncbi:MAG: 2-oxoglutarate dehydrogenase E1 component [Deltaproteobacteria bacterium]|nr:2-oxoglutarate dehydrogenase E1 component [Deltaproteobacteria bacterium]
MARGAKPPSGSDDFAEFGINAALVDEIHHRYEVDPDAVHPEWAPRFGGTAAARPALSTGAAAPAPPPAAVAPESVAELGAPEAERHARSLRMIHAFRARGHRVADTDPLGGRDSYFAELDPAHYGFGNDDLDKPCVAGDLPGGPVQTLDAILGRLRRTYCRSVGVEFTHVQDAGCRTFLQNLMEKNENTPDLSNEKRLRILEKLYAAELFENFLHTRFLGQKRFSLEGAETLIPLLDAVVEEGGRLGMREFVIGMAHRGRLNVLSNIMGKSLESMFSEFEDIEDIEQPFGSGDVKYHKGFSSDRDTLSGNRVHLTLTANPSHLEAVNPVVEGRVRAKQVRSGDTEGRTAVPLLIHGDAAFAGQGLVAETLNLSQVTGYSTGGTVHVVVNNQIGFTTNPYEARSTLYCTDVAKMIQVPIFHVNADDPEAVLHCVYLAMAYRQRFRADVVIDLVCYRRHGHNEGDDPSYTQPLLYEKIRKRPSTRKIYTEHLIEVGVLQESRAREMEEDLRAHLDRSLDVIETHPPGPDEPYAPHGPWTGFDRTAPDEDPETGVSREVLAQVAEGMATLPPGFNLHRKLATFVEKRRKVVAEDGDVDWATGESLAFGSLLLEGTPVRLSGQDSTRGTFSQRHAAFVDQKTGAEYAPLDHLADNQGRFEVYDSILSEQAVLGFEYGYSLADPTTLTLWEAQFGDFGNGAQVIIDQFIACAHVKWQRMSGLVMLLPHGYEGQGPEHSSARIERFLQLCAEDSLQVANCTTPAQYFHLLRRQMHRRYRAPLVVFTPKSLLRHKRAVSKSRELAEGCFQRIIDDSLTAVGAEAAERVILCSGKVYYDLLAERVRRYGEGDSGGVALVRVEQLYPWPGARLGELLGRYASAERVVWCQEEPVNMGPWSFVRERFQDLLGADQELVYAGRRESASPATGSGRLHREQQAELVAAAFNGLPS